MSEKQGSVRYAAPQLQYLGGTLGDVSQLSPRTRDAIDSEIQHIVTVQFARQQFPTEHRPALESLAAGLLRRQMLDRRVVRQALDRRTAAA